MWRSAVSRESCSSADRETHVSTDRVGLGDVNGWVSLEVGEDVGHARELLLLLLDGVSVLAIALDQHAVVVV